ncbi:MAG: helix-turn-helix transcriptional regulator [Paenibacillus sp.]|jgi:LuxR family maltose regulon positive regulatory protein|nr:helix-turn-helix transcriptional regulator [Paenibacillus sp.]
MLTTKLYIPQPRTKIVYRPRLIERLDEGLKGKLTLVSAPAGFGKTTLISEWAKGCERPVAWLSLDEKDNDIAHFLTLFIAALQTVTEEIGKAAALALQSPQPPSAASILSMLINEISTLSHPFLLVLDDCHVIGAKPIDEALAFLLEHLPPQMHIVMITRENPQFPLGRLRAQSCLNELRASDLRFSPGEAAAFLNQVMSLRLSSEEIAALEARTEGWIAGLQLAALSMQGREDVSSFVRAFSGDNRYIVDYLVEEVLQRQPDAIRSFLLQTSVLDRLNGSLCDAVTLQAESKLRLEFLERGNFFVIPLDDNRHWYRYHHLFGEVLSAHLKADLPDQVAILHRRASEWYERHGSEAEAIRHALAAKDFTRAAALLELACPAMSRSRKEAALLDLLRKLPDDLMRCRPVLSVWYAGALLANGKLSDVEDRLQDAERWLDTTADMHKQSDVPPMEMVVADEEQFRVLPGAIAMYRTGYALASGDLPAVIQHARQVVELASGDDHIQRGAASALLGLAHWTGGDLDAAYRSFADGMASMEMAGNIADAIGGSLALADIRMTQGQLRQAMRTYERGLQLAKEHGNPVMRGTADMYVGMSGVCCERNDLRAAMQHLLNSKDQGEQTGFPQNEYRRRVAMARIREAEGDLDGALALLNEAEQWYASDFYPNVRPVAALKTRVWIAQGKLRDALDWVREQRMSAIDDLSYLREFEHITLARVLLAQYQNDRMQRSLLEATSLLERLLHAAEEGGRIGSAIEILILQAIARHAQQDIPAALLPLERALNLAEPEGYVRTFVAEGPPMAKLLGTAAKQGLAPNYVHNLLAAIGIIENSPPAQQQFMADPLSERELDVLRRLATDLSGPDIARELMISLNTLRTHTKHIYDKLEVNNRRAAVRRAKELDLL